jgi:glycosyltransferase involved in cell wall biosynthesis
VLERAKLLMPVSRTAEQAVETFDRPRVRVPIPIEPIEGAAERDIDAVAYASWPMKRGLEVICSAWPGGRLVIGGADRAKGVAWLRRNGVAEPPGIEWAGELPREKWLDRVRRARVFVDASRWEDFGIAPMEALAAGTPVVTLGAESEALPLLRELDPRLVTREEGFTDAIRAGLAMGEDERADYARRASELLAPYREDAIARVVAEDVLPGLGL